MMAAFATSDVAWTWALSSAFRTNKAGQLVFRSWSEKSWP